MSLQILCCLQPRQFPDDFLIQSETWLSDDEKKQLTQAELTPAISTRLLGRFALRYLLHHYASWAPKSFTITVTPQGKPELNNTPFHFSVTHSGDWLMLAFCEGHALGIDYEHQRINSNYLKIAKRFFAASEVRELEKDAFETQATRFNQMWSAKEAILKATGSGIANMLDKVIISPENQCFYLTEPRFDMYQLTGCYWDNGWLHLFSEQKLSDFHFIELTPTLEIQKRAPTLIQDYNRSANL